MFVSKVLKAVKLIAAVNARYRRFEIEYIEREIENLVLFCALRRHTHTHVIMNYSGFFSFHYLLQNPDDPRAAIPEKFRWRAKNV